MKLSVPFIPDQAYAAFLKNRRSSLSSVYFPLAVPDVWDARVNTAALASGHDPVPALVQGLAPLKGVKKYILMNTRLVLPATYSDTGKLICFLDAIARLAKQIPVQGIVFSDFYLLRALDRTGHDIIPDLEAVPGVNSMMDTMGKIQACLDMISTTRFRPPSRLLLDRSLNRNLSKVSAIRGRVKQAYPGMGIELLANEGCLLNCPFKPAHDGHIALSNSGLVRESTWKTNQDVGCHDFFFTHPDQFFKSPFIRPEDLAQYDGLADAVKLCGRTLGLAFLTRCILAYQAGMFEGNLLDLMDAAHFLSHRFYIDNTLLGEDFFLQLSSCTNQCKTCRLCHRLFQISARKKSVTLKRYKDIT